MKRLTLIRHANADWKNLNVPDAERPLSPRGLMEAEALAQLLLEHDLIPDLLLTSPARRTQQTTEILTRTLALPAERIKSVATLYLAPTDDLLTLIQAARADVTHLAIVGHNPGLSELVRRLASPDSGALELTTATACSLTFQSDWPRLVPPAMSATNLRPRKDLGLTT